METYPPDYMEGIEPHWNKIRPLVIDSSNQFVIKPPPTFSLNQESEFYKDLIEVYEIGNNLSEEQKEIASFGIVILTYLITKGMQCLPQKKLPWRTLDWNYKDCF